MSEQTTLKVNSSKETEFQFDVDIQGLNDDNASKAEVRFVIVDVNGQYDVSLKCGRTTTNKWMVRIPALNLTSVQQPFLIEVIVDGYYFVPVCGNLNVVSTPTISLGAHMASKPVVSAAFISTEVIEGTEPTKVRRLLESSEMTPDQQKDLSNKVRIASKVLTKAGKVLENSDATNKIIAGTLDTVKQAIGLVEVKVYVLE